MVEERGFLVSRGRACDIVQYAGHAIGDGGFGIAGGGLAAIRVLTDLNAAIGVIHDDTGIVAGGG